MCSIVSVRILECKQKDNLRQKNFKGADLLERYWRFIESMGGLKYRLRKQAELKAALLSQEGRKH